MEQRGNGVGPGGEGARSDNAKAPVSGRKRNAKKQGRWRHTYAAIDVGTNNCRLLIAKPVPTGFRVIDAYSRTVRLGERVDETGVLSPAAMDRAVTALRVCASKVKRRGVSRTRAIATEACRTAGNGLEFIDRVARETGIKLDIITADEEARLAVAGCAALVDRTYDGAMIFDIGGGSTEIVWLDLRGNGATERNGLDQQGIVTWTSLPFGVVNLAEQFKHMTAGPAQFDAMTAEIHGLLEGFDEADALRPMFDAGRVHMLGTSGTVTTLAGIHLGLSKYNRARVDGVWMDVADTRSLVSDLVAMTPEQRMGVPCVGKERAALLLAGCAIFEAICRLWTCPRLRIADRGLREGMLLALMDKADRERPRRSRRRRNQRASGRHRPRRGPKETAAATP